MLCGMALGCSMGRCQHALEERCQAVLCAPGRCRRWWASQPASLPLPLGSRSPCVLEMSSWGILTSHFQLFNTELAQLIHQPGLPSGRGLQAGLTPTQQLPDGEFWGRNGQRWNFPRCLCMGCTASHGRAPGPAPAPRGEPIFTAPRSESFSLSSLPLPKTSSALPQLPGPPVYSLPAPKPLISLFGPW